MTNRKKSYKVGVAVLLIVLLSVWFITSGRVSVDTIKGRLNTFVTTDAPTMAPSHDYVPIEGGSSTVIPDFMEPIVAPSLVNGLKKPENKIDELVLGAVDQYGVTNSYDGAYRKLSYPNGDVALSTGVCTDVVIRAFRRIGVDLQKEIHLDMKHHFRKYPRRWGLKSPDANIDHRRVPNMEVYFTRKGYKIPIGESTDVENYQPGDLVVWRINGKLTHIGIVSDELVPETSRYYIIHNPIQGVEISDWLNEFEIINHFRLQSSLQKEVSS